MVLRLTEDRIKKMAELLKSGAVMLDASCPLCNSPLFKLKSGEVVCPVHGPVKIVKSESEVVELRTKYVLDRLESLITQQLDSLVSGVEREGEADIEYLEKIKLWLEILERVRRVKKG